jgi:hypothetical protein
MVEPPTGRERGKKFVENKLKNYIWYQLSTSQYEANPGR